MVEQTLVYAYFSTYHDVRYKKTSLAELHRLRTTDKELKQLHNTKQFYVVILMDHPKSFLRMIKKWLPIHRALVTETSYQSRVIDQQTHKDLLDVLRNPNYNRFEGK